MTIIPRNGRFGVKVLNRGTGKYKWLGTFDTEHEALLAEEVAKAGRSKDVPTVAAWGKVWLSDYAREAASTQSNYRHAVDRITRDIGKLRLDELTRPEARRIATQEWPRSVSKVAKTMWADAVRDGVCEMNPWEKMKLQVSRGRKDIDALTPDEVMRLGDLALLVHDEYGPEARAAILTLGLTAMRPGELCALRWQDVDMANGEVTVAGSRNSSGTITPPKNKLGRRIVLPALAVEALREVPRVVKCEFVFHSKRGRPLRKGSVYTMFQPVRAAWLAEGGRYIVPYALRHACATALVEAEMMPADVAFQLGHKDGGRLVQEVYGHPRESQIRDRLKMATEGELRKKAV